MTMLTKNLYPLATAVVGTTVGCCFVVHQWLPQEDPNSLVAASEEPTNRVTQSMRLASPDPTQHKFSNASHGIPSTTTALLASSPPTNQPRNNRTDASSSSSPPPPLSWIQRRILFPIHRSTAALPTPRRLTRDDPALRLSHRCLRQRQRDEETVRRLLQQAADTSSQSTQGRRDLGQELFQVIYGRGVTPQQREDFLVRYGCTGWTDDILNYILRHVASGRGVVEIGAGHGQWARALSDAFIREQGHANADDASSPTKRFDFVLAYDDRSNLPLNTHVYNPYTQPHHDYFGKVHPLQQNEESLQRVLRSWHCRGRVLMVVYPPPGPMAVTVLRTYVAADDRANDTFVLVGEGRGGANGDDALFDMLENGEWVLLKELPVRRPPGDKGYERCFVFQRRVVAAAD